MAVQTAVLTYPKSAILTYSKTAVITRMAPRIMSLYKTDILGNNSDSNCRKYQKNCRFYQIRARTFVLGLLRGDEGQLGTSI